MYDVLIIGGGPGGIYAGIISSLRYLNSCIIEATDVLGGQPMSLYPDKFIEDLPGIKLITGEQFTNNLVDQLNNLKDYKPDIMLKTTINEITKNDNHFEIKLNSGNILQAKSIIISTGLGVYEPISFDQNEVEVIDTSNVLFTYKENELREKSVLVLGGGDSALDWANHLVEQDLTNKVSILHRRNEWRAREDKVNKLTTNNINIFMNKKVTKVDKNSITFIDNDSEQEQTHTFDKILVQYGVKLNANSITTSFKDINIKTNRKILVDMNCKTSHDLIYAIGSACEYDCAPNMILCSMSDAARAVYHLRRKVKE